METQLFDMILQQGVWPAAFVAAIVYFVRRAEKREDSLKQEARERENKLNELNAKTLLVLEQTVSRLEALDDKIGEIDSSLNDIKTKLDKAA